MILKNYLTCLVVFSAFTLTGCGEDPDPSQYLQPTPKSILVLPALNESVEVTASDDHLSVISRPLAEAGYYVFPVAVVRDFMKENGQPTARDMHNIPLTKLHEIFGADAIMYMTIEDWGDDYQVLSTNTHVAMTFHLVDGRTGSTIWKRRGSKRQSFDTHSQNLVSQLVGAAASKILSSAIDIDHSTPLARSICQRSIRKGLLKGHRHPKVQEAIAQISKTTSQ